MVQAININYIELTGACNEILWRIRLSILVKLGITHKVYSKIVDKQYEPGFPNMTFAINQESSHYQQEILPQLLLVDDVLGKFVGDLEQKANSSDKYM